MSNNKSIDIEKYANLFKALSNPNRLKIFQRLVSCCGPGTKSNITMFNESCCVGELGKECQIVPSTVSHHIKELKQAGIIKTERHGQRIECWIDPEIIKKLSEFLEGK